MKVIVGLGNIGAQFENTYHNMGFMVADVLCKRFDVMQDAACKVKKCSVADYTEIWAAGAKFMLVKPRTYMNLSGNAVLYFMSKFKVKPSDFIIIYDDIDLERGQVRVRTNGSAGTHNGMRDIVAKIGEEIPRVRVGVGKPANNLREFVTSKIQQTDNEGLQKGVIAAADLVYGHLVYKKPLENRTI